MPDAAGGLSLEVRDLVTAYGAIRALNGVSLTVPAGSITAVLGANGAGKSSLLRTLSGLVKPRSGSVLLDGKEIAGRAPEDVVQLGMSHVPEGRGVIAELTVDENLRLGGLWRKDKTDRSSALEEVYVLFPPLDQRRKRLAMTLSGGERQMLALGRALVARPRVLLLDEPSLGLAPRITSQIMGLVRRLCDESGLTVLLVEQNARSALSVADHGIVLNLGAVVASDHPAKLRADDNLRHAYLGF
ncbi:MAG: branched-chain amino acid transport system ATP-binding protein [Actinomycetota bacterium]|nr:branched-chain amino acid transport system ATP-binding protein [Actinomycetota bacterium]